MLSLQIKRKHRTAHWFRQADEPWPDYGAPLRIVEPGAIPKWGQAIGAAWWRWAGRGPPHRALPRAIDR